MHCFKLHQVLPPIVLALFITSIISAQHSQNTSEQAAPSAGETSIVESFAVALGSAKTDDARKSILAARPELMTSEVSKALMARGETLRVQGEYPAALNLHKSALDIYTQLKDEAGMARALNRIGRVRLAQNEFKAALENHEQSLTLWMKLGGKDAGIADVFNDMGRTYYAMRDYDRAQAAYEKAFKAAEESGSKAARAAALNGFGIVRFFRGDLKPALEFYQQSLRLCEEIGDQENGSNALNNIALVYSALGDHRLAIEFYEKSIKRYEALGAKLRAARSLVNLANVFNLLDDHVSALKVLRKAITISETLKDKAMLAMALNTTGDLYFTQGNDELALHYFQQSLELREAVGVKGLTVGVLHGIADVYRVQGRYEQALETMNKALAISEEIKEQRSILEMHEGIGDVYLAQDNYEMARNSYGKSLSIAEQINRKPSIGVMLAKLGAVYEKQGAHLKALEYADRAATLAHELGTPDLLWRARTTAGQAHKALQQKAESRRAFDEAIEAIENLRRQIAGGERERQSFFTNKLAPYMSMIQLLLEQGDERAAFAYAERAKARVLLDVLHSGRVEINKALTTPERTRERSLSGELSALNEQVRRERERDKPDAARLNDLLTRQQKARLDYEAFQANLYAAHPELAAQRGEARPATLDELGALVPDANTALLEYVVAEDRTLLFVITKRDESKQPERAAQTSARHAHALPGVKTRIAATQTKSTTDLHVFTISITRDELARRVAQLHRQIATRDLLFSAEARGLYQTLLAPAAILLQNRTRLIFVPDAALWEVPFQALQSPNNEYVVERHAISYAPSLSVLGEIARGRARRAQRPSSNSVLLAFGNPFLGRGGRELAGAKEENAKNVEAKGATNPKDSTLADLPEAERQVRLLGALYGAARSRIYTGAEAREERVKREAPNFRILHLATHSVLDDSSPMYSHVLLTASESDNDVANKNGAEIPTPDASGDDGLLEAWEMMQLNLQADMVVLSACETARGRVASGEGMIGLSWALFVAGSPTTVVSQWKVESASTTELMLAFYRNLQSGSVQPNSLRRGAAPAMSKAEALRQASLILLRTERYRHPLYWAGFIVIGDGD